MNEQQLKNIIESVIYASDQPMDLNQLMSLFPEDQQPGSDAIKAAIASLQEECESRSIELKEVKSGFRFQVKQDYAEWVSKLWEEKPARYSRASLETLALIAYRQPVTRAEIEEVRGVSVSSQIIKAFVERDWVKVVGHRDVPGKPSLYATTKGFLDYFNLKNLEDLPSLAEIRDIDSINEKLDLSMPGEGPQSDGFEEDITVNDSEITETEDDADVIDINSSSEEVIADEGGAFDEVSDMADSEEDPVVPALTAEN
ncbi:MAG: SMC-Scp complex subunit ScpB [Gammaproteobacteria bacterium]|nr:SMC-Scp complex subunit ScpB [Gammaproteobacteria bacterium]